MSGKGWAGRTAGGKGILAAQRVPLSLGFGLWVLELWFVAEAGCSVLPEGSAAWGERQGWGWMGSGDSWEGRRGERKGQNPFANLFVRGCWGDRCSRC